MKPQIIKISAQKKKHTSFEKSKYNICPFQMLQIYLNCRKTEISEQEPFFMFRDRTPVLASQFRRTLKSTLDSMGIDSKRYLTHGFRTGRALDVLKMGLSVETIKKLGRWISNAVFTYIM